MQPTGTLVQVAFLLRVNPRASARNGWNLMNEDDDLVLNAKAIGLAVGGAALAGMLFVLTRRDEKHAPSVETLTSAPGTDTFANAAREAATAAKSHRESVEEAINDGGKSPKDAVTSSSGDISALERDLKAAAWDAQERARIAESKLREAGSKVAGDAANVASRVGEEARHIAEDGKSRFSYLRRPGSFDSEAQRVTDELDAQREETASKTTSAGKDVLGVKKKLAGKKVGPLPEGVAGEAASAALENLEKSLKSKAPLLLAARNRAQALEIVQRELGPILRDSALLALSTAVGSAERASQKAASAPRDLKQRLRHETEANEAVNSSDAEDKVRGAQEAASAEVLKARDEAEAEARTARAEADRLKAELAAKLEELKQSASDNGSRILASLHKDEPATTSEPSAAPDQEGATAAHADSGRGIPVLLWGGAGVGLAIYALMDPERRESILKLANEASVQVQELVRDLQGYDDEF